MEANIKNKILINESTLAYFSDLFEPTYRRFRLIRSNGERRKIRIHNLKMHRKYVKFLDTIKFRNPSLHWLSTTKIRSLEDRLKNVFNMYDGNYPEEIVEIWKTGKMPFILLSKRKDKVVLGIKVCKLYLNKYDIDVQARKLLLDGMVVRTEQKIEGNFEYYKDETITGEEFRNIPTVSSDLTSTISCNLFHYYFAKHDPAEYDDGSNDYDISFLKEIEQMVNGEEKIMEVKSDIKEDKKETDTWDRCVVRIITYDHKHSTHKSIPLIWDGNLIIRNLDKKYINVLITEHDDIVQIMSHSIICGETNPRASDRMSLLIYSYTPTTDPTLSTALSITKHIDLHASRRYIVIARKGSGKTSKTKDLSQYFEVVDSDLYGIWLKNFLLKNHLFKYKPSELKESLKNINDVEVNEDIVKFYEYSKNEGPELYDRNSSIFRELADGLLRKKEEIDGPINMEEYDRISPSYCVSLSNMINQYLGLQKIGIGMFIEIIAAIKDSTKPLLVFMHSTEESGFLRTPDFTFSMPDVFDSEDIVRYRNRGKNDQKDGNNYGELLLYETYLMQTSTIQPFIPFPVLMSWVQRIGGEIISISLNE